MPKTTKALKRPRRWALPLATLAVVALLAAVAVLSNSREGGFGRIEAEPGFSSFTIRNSIDQHIVNKLQEAKIEPSDRCTDEEFARRAYLDLVGMIPSPAETKVFLTDKNPDKRAKLVEYLLKDPRYGTHWAVWWGDMLREHSNGQGREGTLRGSYREWIKDALNANLPYDKFVTELITATGRADQSGAVNFYLRDENDRVETANNVSNVFMGTRMSCAQCHDHPFDKWEQKDFHSLMAFLEPRTSVQQDAVATLVNMKNVRGLPKDMAEIAKPYIERAEKELATADKAAEGEPAGGGMMGGMDNSGGKGKQVRKGGQPSLMQDLNKEIESKLGKEKVDRFRQIVGNNQIRKVVERPIGDYRMPAEGDSADARRKTGEIVEPVFPWNPEQKAGPRESRREALSKYLAASRQFAAVQVNRLWAKLLGRGIVHPVDDFREKNPPTHPELLSYLTDEFIKAKFDSKHIIKLIMSSSTYDRSSKPTKLNKDDTTLYSHARLRRMTAEQVFDSILMATGRTEGLKDLGKKMEMEIGGDGNNPARRARPAGGEGQWAFYQPTPSRNGQFMNLFNQPDREQITIEREESGSIAQSLELLNGGAINSAVVIKPGTLAQALLDAKKDGTEIATELYLATLSRYPTPAELGVAKAVLIGKPPQPGAVEDFQWALLNTREFMFIK